MAQLFVPLTGSFAALAGSGFNVQGENLDRPLWRGAELSDLSGFRDVMGAVAEAEFHEWIIGVRHPLYQTGGAAWCRFFDPDVAQREQACAVAVAAAQQAHHLGARYICFPFPGTDSLSADWTEAQIFEAGRAIFDHLATAQEREQINIVLAPESSHPALLEGEIYERLFAEFPTLSLYFDISAQGTLAQRGEEELLTLCRRWLPFIRYLRLSSADLSIGQEIAREVVATHRSATLVLTHDPEQVLRQTLEAAHTWVSTLVRPVL